MSLSPLTAELLRMALPQGTRRLLALGVGLWAASMGMALSPLSPLAMDRADGALVSGRADVAAQRYDQVAAWALLPSTREVALERGARVWGGQLAHPAEARARVEQLLTRVDGPAERARLLAWSADLYMAEFRPGQAAVRYQAAAEALPGTHSAGVLRVSAARAWQEAGQPVRAEGAWQRVLAEHPSQRSEAWVGLAGLHLSRGEAAEALRHYERAALRTDDAHLEAVARLGAASCLERLGDLDEAIAELDQVELPDSVWARRVEGLRTRQSAGAL